MSPRRKVEGEREWEAEVTPSTTTYRRKPLATTWWSRLWVDALEGLGRTYASRLPRGRTYARQGRVRDLEVTRGRARAWVWGSRPKPYRTEITLRPFRRDEWDCVVRALAGRARYTARLLAGEMPEDIEAVLEEERIHLFPTERDDLASRCSCPDWASPCKHVAALHYVLAQALDDDPFLLFTLRGRDRDALLAALAAARSGTGPVAGATTDAHAVALETLDPGAYRDAPRPLPAMSFYIGDPADATAALAALRVRAEWIGPLPVDLLAPHLRTLSAAAVDVLGADLLTDDES